MGEGFDSFDKKGLI